MKPKIHVVLDQDDTVEHQRLLNGLGGLEVGRVVCELRPGQRNLDWLAGDLLRSLGKRADMAGNGRNATRRWRRARAWVQGEQIDDVIVSRAYHCMPGGWLHLLELQRESDCDLWLVVQRKHVPRLHAATLPADEFEQIPFETFARRWARRRTPQLPHSHGLVTPTTREDLPLGLASLRVPLVEFPDFPHRCRKLLEPERAAFTEATFVSAAQATVDWLRTTTPSEGTTAEFIRTLIADAPTLDEVLTRLRGAQTALFANWWLLKVDLDALAAARDEDALSPLTPDATRLLRHYASTTHAALATLVLAARPPLASLADATLGAVHDGMTIDLPGHDRFDLPAYAQGIVAAHVAYRRLQHATADDPLFASRLNGTVGATVLKHFKPNGLRAILNKVGADTGLALTVRGASWKGSDESHWRRRYGISIQPIPKGL